MLTLTQHFRIETIHSAFRFSWDEHFVFHGERHDIWEMVFVTEGEVVSTEDEKIYVLRANDLILHAPMEFHRIRSAKGHAPKGIIFSFRASGQLPKELKNGVFALPQSEAAAYRDICEQILDLKNGALQGDYARQEIADLLSVFLIRLAGKTAQKRLDTTTGALEYRRVIFAMSEAVEENLTLADIAARCNISVSYVKQLFRRYAGVSPKHYFARLRARRAAELLSKGLGSAEVAERMCFSSPNYFTLFFKRYMGVTPSAFRRGER